MDSINKHLKMAATKLKDISKKPLGPKSVNCKIVLKNGATDYTVADDTGYTKLSIEKERHHFSKYLIVGKFVRIVNCNYCSETKSIRVHEKTSIFLGKTIIGLKEPPSSDAGVQHFTLSKVKELPPHTICRETIPAKIVELKVIKVRTMYGLKDARRLTLKDLSGTKLTLTMWGLTRFKEVEQGHVYLFRSLEIDSYPAIKPHNLKLSEASSIQRAPSKLQDEMKSVKLEDGSLPDASIIGFQDIYKYVACTKCKKSQKGQEISKCTRCDNEAFEPYFRFTLVLKKGEEDMQSFIGFKDVLDFDLKNEATGEDVEEELNNRFEGKKATLTFKNQRESMAQNDEEASKQEAIILSLKLEG